MLTQTHKPKGKNYASSWDQVKNKISPKSFDCYHNSIEIIYQGHLNPISEIQLDEETKKSMQVSSKEEFTEIIIGNALHKIAKNYVGRKGVQKENLETCCSFVRRNFSNLSVPELIHAFELAFSGKIEVDTNLYGNEFSAGFVGKILKHYSKYRIKVLELFQPIINSELDLSEVDDEEKNQKNKAARKQLIRGIIQCYEKYWEGENYKLPMGLFQFLKKLRYQLIPDVEKKENAFREKIKLKIMSPDERNAKTKLISTYNDRSVTSFFIEMKNNNIAPEEFEKDIQKRLKNYETNFLNQLKNKPDEKFK